MTLPVVQASGLQCLPVMSPVVSQLVGLFLSAELRAELSGPGQIVLYQPDLHISPHFLFLHVPVCGYLGLSSKVLCRGFQIRELDTRIILAAGGSLIPFLLVIGAQPGVEMVSLENPWYL